MDRGAALLAVSSIYATGCPDDGFLYDGDRLRDVWIHRRWDIHVLIPRSELTDISRYEEFRVDGTEA